jgi:hypothetical protein
MNGVPSQAEFLAAPLAALQPYAPASLMYAAAGTRRAAALAGYSSESEEYVQWSRSRMVEVLQLLFAHHVQHIFTIPATPGQFAEVGDYRRHLVRWIEWGVAGDEAMADYDRLGWRVRLLTVGVDELAGAQARLGQLRAAGDPTAKTLWYMVVADTELFWQRLLETAVGAAAVTRAAVAQAFYGEAIPDITLYLAFGKPVIAPEFLPPLLYQKVDCYWTQRPGYQLSEAEWRTVLYDHAVLRSTWRADKSDRAGAALAQRAAWEHGPILGLGQRLGPYWYPQPTPSPANIDRDESAT